MVAARIKPHVRSKNSLMSSRTKPKSCVVVAQTELKNWTQNYFCPTSTSVFGKAFLSEMWSKMMLGACNRNKLVSSLLICPRYLAFSFKRG